MAAREPSIAIVIPAFNEVTTIGDVVRDTKKALAGAYQHYSIIVVDDGSKDKTGQTAATAGAHVISHILNSGTGAATATGLSYADQHQFDIAVTMDADGQHHPADVIAGIRALQKAQYDLLIGSRLIDSHGMSKVKRLGNRGLSFITYLLFGINVTDSQSGLRVFSKKALQDLKWKTNGYEFCSEMLWRARQKGLSISEYPIKAIYTEYSKSKGQSNWNAFNIIKALLRRRLLELINE